MIALARPDHRYSSTALSLAIELAKRNRVFFVENPFTVKDLILLRNTHYVKNRKGSLISGKGTVRNIPGMPDNFFHVVPRVILPINWVGPGLIYNLLSYMNDRIMYRAFKRVIKDFALKDFIYINSFNPFFGRYFPGRYKPRLFIYQSVDDISQSAHVSRHGLRLENEMVKRADVTITTSTELKRLKSGISPNVRLIPNAADISIFASVFSQKYPRPSEFNGIDRQIVIYIGNIDDRINFGLCLEVARRRPLLAFFFIGPKSTDQHINLGLPSLPNVYFIGGKRINELPAYLQHANCSIIPFVCTKLTRSIYPLKINEYLAAGMPVVATRFSEDIEDFKDIIYLANTADEFAAGIDKALDENNEARRTKRLDVAKENSWSHRAGQVEELIREYTGID